MFGLFKKKRVDEMEISEALRYFKKVGRYVVGIDLYVNEQILFQVAKAKWHEKRGLKIRDNEDFAVIHFFHSKKMFSNEVHPTIIEKNNKTKEYINFEDPKGVFSYIKNIGTNINDIEAAIYNELELYNSSLKEPALIKYITQEIEK